jgi:hypothetical protein
MKLAVLRCPGLHPTVRGWTCRGILVEAVPDSVEVRPGAHPEPGCSVVRCERCGKFFTVCPVHRRSA